MQTPEEHFDDWLTHLPESPEAEDLTAEHAIARRLAEVGHLAVPPDMAARLDILVQAQITAPAVGDTPLHTTQRRQHPPLKRGQHPSLRRWLLWSSAAILLTAICCGVLLVAASHSLPGDPLYGIKRWEQQVAYAVAGTPHDASVVALQQLQQALADLQHTVAQGRSPADIRLALTTVATWTHTCQHAVAALPPGTDQRAAQQVLQRDLAEEHRLLLSFLPRLPWSLQVTATHQLGAIGTPIPRITQVVITPQSDGILLTITGQGFAAPPRLVVDGTIIPATVLTAKATQITALVAEDTWTDTVHTIGVLNPDGTAAESSVATGDTGGDSQQGGTVTPTATPGEEDATPTPGEDETTPTPGEGPQNLTVPFAHPPFGGEASSPP